MILYLYILTAKSPVFGINAAHPQNWMNGVSGRWICNPNLKYLNADSNELSSDSTENFYQFLVRNIDIIIYRDIYLEKLQ